MFMADPPLSTALITIPATEIVNPLFSMVSTTAIPPLSTPIIPVNLVE